MSAMIEKALKDCGANGTTAAIVVRKINQVKRMLEVAEDVYLSIPVAIRDALDDNFTEEGTLRHCIRWGIQTAGEMTEKKTGEGRDR